MSDVIEIMARACASVTADDMNNPNVSAVDWDRVRAALRAALEAGWKLVPVEATSAMVDGAYEATAFDDRWHIEDGDDFKKAVSAMLAAAPDPLKD